MDNQVLEVIKKRSSARAYSDEEVMKEQLEKVIANGHGIHLHPLTN